MATKCSEGCTCGRHVSRKCLLGCTCPQHNKPGGQLKGAVPWNKGTKGRQEAWNKGCPVPPEQKAKQQETLNRWYSKLSLEDRSLIYGRERTPAMRRRISEALKGNQKLSDLMTKRRRNSPEKFQGGSRGKSGKRADIGFYVRSTWEANYVRYLSLLKGRGEIVSFEYEPKRFDFPDIKRGTRSYLPDFKIVWSDGRVEYHEVKGYWNSSGKTAVKRFRKRYPKETLVIIDHPVYKKLTVEWAFQIPNWET